MLISKEIVFYTGKKKLVCEFTSFDSEISQIITKKCIFSCKQKRSIDSVPQIVLDFSVLF